MRFKYVFFVLVAVLAIPSHSYASGNRERFNAGLDTIITDNRILDGGLISLRGLDQAVLVIRTSVDGALDHKWAEDLRKVTIPELSLSGLSVDLIPLTELDPSAPVLLDVSASVYEANDGTFWAYASISIYQNVVLENGWNVRLATWSEHQFGNWSADVVKKECTGLAAELVNQLSRDYMMANQGDFDTRWKQASERRTKLFRRNITDSPNR